MAPAASSISCEERLKSTTKFPWGSTTATTAAGRTTGYAKWWGFAAIFKYDFAAATEFEGYFALRAERVWDEDASRIGLAGNGGTAERYSEITATFGWRATANLLLRFEYRWDKANRNIYEGATNQSGGQSYQSTLAVNSVLTF